MRFRSYAPCTIQTCIPPMLLFLLHFLLHFFGKIFDLIHLPYPYYRRVFSLLTLSSYVCTLFLSSFFSLFHFVSHFRVIFLWYTFEFLPKKLHFTLHFCFIFAWNQFSIVQSVVVVDVVACSLRRELYCYRKRCRR